MRKSTIPSLSAQKALQKLGADICSARKRREMTQRRLADGAGVSLPTIRRLENGDEGVSLATLAMVFVVLGEVSRLANLLDVGIDDVGLMLSNQRLPKRVRAVGVKKSKSDLDEPGEAVANRKDSLGESF